MKLDYGLALITLLLAASTGLIGCASETVKPPLARTTPPPPWIRVTGVRDPATSNPVLKIDATRVSPYKFRTTNGTGDPSAVRVTIYYTDGTPTEEKMRPLRGPEVEALTRPGKADITLDFPLEGPNIQKAVINCKVWAEGPGRPCESGWTEAPEYVHYPEGE